MSWWCPDCNTTHDVSACPRPFRTEPASIPIVVPQVVIPTTTHAHPTWDSIETVPETEKWRPNTQSLDYKAGYAAGVAALQAARDEERAGIVALLKYESTQDAEAHHECSSYQEGFGECCMAWAVREIEAKADRRPR